MRVMLLTLWVVCFFGCASSRVADRAGVGALEGTTWQATEFRGERVEGFEADSFTLSFNEGDELGGVAVCNRVMGRYENSLQGRMEINVVGMTMMYCPNIEFETTFVETLDRVTRYAVDGERLTLYNDREVVMVLILK